MTSLADILAYIRSSGDHELSEIIRAILARSRSLYPEEEVVFLSLPLRDPEERAEVLRGALEQLTRK